MAHEMVKTWFGSSFKLLHPLLQQLHIDGGRLVGDVEVSYGNPLARLLGRGLAKKMRLPNAGAHKLVVDIRHDDDGLHWGRCFNDQELVYSLFQPVGTIDNGHWVETTGPITLFLTVDVNNGGWYWRCTKVKLRGVTIPKWFVPKTTAYKFIENESYRFHVEVSLPWVGTLFSYKGLLESDVNRA